jgi:hypothetical protein
MGEQSSVSKMPQTARVIGHHIGFPGNVVVSGNVAMHPLMQRVETE